MKEERILANNLERDEIAEMLSKHREDTFHQDTGRACVCGSHSRAELPYDPAWRTFTQHQADVITRRWREVPPAPEPAYVVRLALLRNESGVESKILDMGGHGFASKDAALNDLMLQLLNLGYLREWRKDA